MKPKTQFTCNSRNENQTVLYFLFRSLLFSTLVQILGHSSIQARSNCEIRKPLSSSETLFLQRAIEHWYQGKEILILNDPIRNKEYHSQVANGSSTSKPEAPDNLSNNQLETIKNFKDHSVEFVNNFFLNAPSSSLHGKLLYLIHLSHLQLIISQTLGIQNFAYNRLESHFMNFLLNSPERTDQNPDSFSREISNLYQSLSNDLQKYFDQPNISKDPNFMRLYHYAKVYLNFSYAVLNLEIKDQKNESETRYLLWKLSAQGLAGASVVVLSFIIAPPTVIASTEYLGSLGTITAGGLIGLAGAEGSTFVTINYQMLTDAYIKSFENGTDFSCELREVTLSYKMKNDQEIQFAAMEGIAAGSAFVGLSLYLPKTITYSTVFFTLGYSILEGSKSAFHAYHFINTATELEAFLILKKAQNQLNIGDEKEAKKLAVSSLKSLQTSGLSLLNSSMTGIIYYGLNHDLQEAIQSGLDILYAIIVSRTADNTAVAIHDLLNH